MPIFEVIFPNIKGTNQVKFCGSWDRWQKLTQLHFDQIRNIWIKDIELEYGQFEVKFLRNTYDWVVTDLLAIRPAYGIEGPANIITVHKKHSDEQTSGTSLTTFPSLGSDLNSSQNQRFEKSTKSELIFYIRRDKRERSSQRQSRNNSRHSHNSSEDSKPKSKHRSQHHSKLKHSHILNNKNKTNENLEGEQLSQIPQLPTDNAQQNDLQANEVESMESDECVSNSRCCCLYFFIKKWKRKTQTKEHKLFQFSYLNYQ
ncbi:MAG: hypothetical protein EZS28_021268 [Streblomastix strix]|uniref:AMP-activated protein kinase glycogen-binding domain-containing protein n=1 Tax=Streblomastix strix TaxID=222440 RepID=A0A5J4VL76_9EUKA|nr:MAG: hypothetical protein EZS28_021268 [Streblomastix strix]